MKKSFFLGWFLGFMLLMAFDTLAQTCFKLTALHANPLEASPEWLLRVFSNPFVYGSFVGYFGAFFTWMTLLKKLSIGSSFAASHLEVVSIMFVSYFMFDEPITMAKIAGAILILAGIVCLAISEEKLQNAAD